MTAREKLLEKIRASMSTHAHDTDRAAAVEVRLATHPANVVPACARGTGPERIARFTAMLEDQGADVARVTRKAAIAPQIAAYLRAHNLPHAIRHGADRRLSGLGWDAAPALERLKGPAHAADAVTLSHADAGASETGTLFLTSGAANPTTLNFVPETHIAIIRARDILGSYEECWDRLRHLHGAGRLPRTVNMISGPSRTADIEQTIVRGAHGPRRLFTIIAG